PYRKQNFLAFARSGKPTHALMDSGMLYFHQQVSFAAEIDEAQAEGVGQGGSHGRSVEIV
ncbi:MAG TPA: hypothetical protein PK858_04685, partial [Saprospiraceae bacterium]|nr:hypothetical protein [Saprospiraceae bacterium]